MRREDAHARRRREDTHARRWRGDVLRARACVVRSHLSCVAFSLSLSLLRARLAAGVIQDIFKNCTILSTNDCVGLRLRLQLLIY